jgi:integrase/recombinase XerD
MKLSRAIRRYVEMKHLMDNTFNQGTNVLQAFSKHVGDVDLPAVAKWQVVAFLDRSVLSDVTWFLRYRILRAFFQYWMDRDELKGLPVPPSRRRTIARAFVPYIYSISEIREIVSKAGLKRKPKAHEFGPVTFQTILLLLYGTGARINEVASLKSKDVDLSHGTVTFRRSPSRPRTVPIGPSLCQKLQDYVDSSIFGRRNTTLFFSRENGGQIRPVDICRSFRIVRREAGLSKPGAVLSRQPMVKDLRRTFAVHCMRRWLKAGKDLRSMLPILSAYLGHASTDSAEEYLAVMPERFSKQISCLIPASGRG